jgi:hypothetical protein
MALAVVLPLTRMTTAFHAGSVPPQDVGLAVPVESHPD